MFDPAPRMLRCHFCRGEFPEDKWFARIRRVGGFELFCSPRCVEYFFDTLGSADRGSEWERENRRLAAAVRKLNPEPEADGLFHSVFGPEELAHAI